ncbi:hypothetical protein [Kribbella sp. NPDC049227]|uniref:hypothetical protein n=1 Tax=Kribbella sp. NPDC049227 TaxID=3364113 RepID=UPI003714C9A0
MSADLQALALAYDETIAELKSQDEQQREWEREERERRAQKSSAVEGDTGDEN